MTQLNWRFSSSIGCWVHRGRGVNAGKLYVKHRTIRDALSLVGETLEKEKIMGWEGRSFVCRSTYVSAAVTRPSSSIAWFDKLEVMR